MPDAQFLAAGTQPAPLDYTLPGAQELLVKACFAHYDGSGAAGAYLPTLQILGPAGDTVAEIPMDSSVAAGASVEATWAPFLKGAAPSPLAYATLFYSSALDTPVTLTPSQVITFHWPNFWTTSKSVFSTGTNTAGDTSLIGAPDGTYVVQMQVDWPLGAYTHASLVQVNGSDGPNGVPTFTGRGEQADVTYSQLANGHDDTNAAMFAALTGGMNLHLNLANGDPSNSHTIGLAVVNVAYLGTMSANAKVFGR